MLFNICMFDLEVEDDLNLLIDIDETSINNRKNLKGAMRKIVDDTCEVERCLVGYIFDYFELVCDDYPNKLRDLLKRKAFQISKYNSTEFNKIVERRPYLQNLSLKNFEGSKGFREVRFYIFQFIMRNEGIAFKKAQVTKIEKWRTN